MDDHKPTTTKARLGLLALIISTIVGAATIYDRINRAHIRGSYEAVPMTAPPVIREHAKVHIDQQDLLGYTTNQVSRQSNPSVALSNIVDYIRKGDLSDVALINLQSVVTGDYLHIALENNGGDAAHNIQIHIRAHGFWEESGHSTLLRGESLVPWTNSIAIRDLAAGEAYSLHVWFGDWVVSDRIGRPSVTYSQGSVLLRPIQQFYGWDAELISKLLRLPAAARWISGGALILLTAFGIRRLWLSSIKRNSSRPPSSPTSEPSATQANPNLSTTPISPAEPAPPAQTKAQPKPQKSRKRQPDRR